jgi:hypothetical protein
MSTERCSPPGTGNDRSQGQEPKEEDVPKLGFTITSMTPVAVADRAPIAGPHEMIRELCSLGLTREASLGILKMLMQSGSRSVATDPGEW